VRSKDVPSFNPLGHPGRELWGVKVRDLVTRWPSSSAVSLESPCSLIQEMYICWSLWPSTRDLGVKNCNTRIRFSPLDYEWKDIDVNIYTFPESGKQGLSNDTALDGGHWVTRSRNLTPQKNSTDADCAASAAGLVSGWTARSAPVWCTPARNCNPHWKIFGLTTLHGEGKGREGGTNAWTQVFHFRQ